jgi:hypothetical protein
MSRIPNYLRVSPQGVIYIDIDNWKKSSEREREIEHTEQLRRYLKK